MEIKMDEEKREYQICITTGKRCYSGKYADIVLSKAKKHKTKKIIPTRKYYCNNCGYYHLTSKAFSIEGKKYYSAKKRKKYIKTLW